MWNQNYCIFIGSNLLWLLIVAINYQVDLNILREREKLDSK